MTKWRMLQTRTLFICDSETLKGIEPLSAYGGSLECKDFIEALADAAATLNRPIAKLPKWILIKKLEELRAYKSYVMLGLKIIIEDDNDATVAIKDENSAIVTLAQIIKHSGSAVVVTKNQQLKQVVNDLNEKNINWMEPRQATLFIREMLKDCV